jgi:hypothetical protein
MVEAFFALIWSTRSNLDVHQQKAHLRRLLIFLPNFALYVNGLLVDILLLSDTDIGGSAISSVANKCDTDV